MLFVHKNNITQILKVLILVLGVVTGIILTNKNQDIRKEAAGNTYFVSTSGSDSNPGTSLSNSWRTIQYAADQVIAGDTVYVRGGVYKEIVTINISGTAESRIVFQAYQNEKPIIDGSKPISGWTPHSGDIYKTSVGVNVFPLVFDDQILRKVSGISALQEGTYYQSGDTLYLWCPGGVSPDEHLVGIIKKFQDWSESPGVKISGDYITFSGFSVKHGSGDGIQNRGDYVSIENCEVAFTVVHGIRHHDVVGGQVINCEVYQNALSNYNRGSHPAWGMGISYWSGSKGKIIGNRVYDNHGEGIGSLGLGGGTKGIEISNNVVYDNFSANIYLCYTTSAKVEKNLAYVSGNQIQPDVYKSTPVCISTAEEQKFGNPGDLKDGIIINNILIGCRNGFSFWNDYRAPEGAGLKNFIIANNTIIDNKERGIAIALGNHQNTIFQNNIIFQDSGGPVLDYKGSSGNTVGFNHNLWFHSSRSELFNWKGTTYTHSGWKSVSGQGEGSISDNPGFAGGIGFDAYSYQIKENSPGIDKGITVSTIADDFWGNERPYGLAYDLGAHEYDSISSKVIVKIRFQGITSKADNQDIKAVFKSNTNELTFNKELESDENGIYTMEVGFPPNTIMPGNLTLLVKGLSHLQKKFAINYQGKGDVFDFSSDQGLQLRAGDVTNDNVISISDIARVSKYYTDLSVPVDISDPRMVAADINKDREITIIDLALIAINWSEFLILGDE